MAINKILVANRGEIASRVIRTAREMDIATVALYSDADRDLPYVRAADESVRLPGTAPADTYLRADLVLAAARAIGADAVHPGYGFLSENEDFARACAADGIVFIGPSPAAIAAMGSKIEAKRIMSDAGVPVLAGMVIESEADEDPSRLAAAAVDIGLPVLVKAAFGGGGRGMRIVETTDELVEAVHSARREAASAFGNGTVFLEKFVRSPRHIEVQIFGDSHGTIVHLGERECSIQRRYQKVVEESPSTAVDAELRDKLGQAAVAAGKALSYEGAGTVEFVMAPDGAFYFLEVNTRLQVEHPVTELVTGTDLVRAQILVAAGEPLPPAVAQPVFTGHAIEVRLYAEDVAAGFIPVSGELTAFEIPDLPGIRVDGGFAPGSVVSTFYDPMLAKVIAYGADRDDARRRLARALDESVIGGVTTNRQLLIGILRDDEFRSGATDTGYLERHRPADLMASRAHPDRHPVHTLIAAVAGATRRRSAAPVLGGLPPSFRTVRSASQRISYSVGDDQYDVAYDLSRTGVSVTVGNREFPDVQVIGNDGTTLDAVIDGVRRTYRVAQSGAGVVVHSSLGVSELHECQRFTDPSELTEEGSLLAPMPGSVVRVEVGEGDRVSAGQAIVVLEAMKMEHTVRAAVDGEVAKLVSVGEQVDSGTVLAIIHDDHSGE
ncbi:ATP-grasp domain-containing protein [Gordonia sp. TBRC 11910]|uniref:biotin carboxylase n=1 Tax=Gordonia asplenii TaxID=2725283 RepID=A0A848KWN7_9ACTN|nr:biotin carboxylase N-terminal domain-containing protein [Gordonia asplenii]NMO00591.1 ATP-grasp domain-containing protein [Gordonia asplenii]